MAQHSPQEESARRRALETKARDSVCGLRRAQLMAGLAHLVVGPGGGFESWSETLPHLVGLPATAVPRNTRAWFSLIDPEDRARFRAAVVAAERSGQRVSVEYRVQRADGEQIHVRQVAEAIGEHGEPRRWFITLQDITRQKRWEEEATRQQAELERRIAESTAELKTKNEDLEAFASSVSHDLRAPLRVIGGFVDILEKEHSAHLPPEARHLLGRVGASARHMSQLTEVLLELARVGLQPLSLKSIALREIVDRCLEDARDEIATRGVEVRVGELPVGEVEPALVANVFRNLLDNALKYTRPCARPVIEIGCERVDGEAVIFVRDNGIGFEMGSATRIFAAFQRLHSGSQFEGAGLGLAIVQRSVHRHGGRVWAESSPGGGATFRFTLG